MAKPKQPLMSFGARGSIGDTLTFQKRGRLTIARQKPIPTDPEAVAQLAQRQVYRDAVAAWRAMSPEEKEAWRGVCPHLTAYQCFMRTELKYVPPEPEPEEYTEEQTEDDIHLQMGSPQRPRVGQTLFIPNRKLIKLSFVLNKTGNPTGNVTYQIRKVSDDSLITSQFLRDASMLTTTATWYELELDTPPTINEQVRLLVYSEAPYYTHMARVGYVNTDEKPGENLCYYANTTYTEMTTWDCAYRYKYYEVE